MSNIKIEAGWKAALAAEFEQPYFEAIAAFLRSEKLPQSHLPAGSLIFNALNSTPFDQVKVVILGQDPYHNPGEAMGLCFSVPRGVKGAALSLLNIYKELKADVGISAPGHGDLSAWTRQGVFLLNAMLTVERNRPQSHQNIGWQTFTDAVIRTLSERREGLVFMLWGNFARKKKALIDAERHLILEFAPSLPLAGNAFSGCRHFSKANAYLESKEMAPVDWRVDG